MLNSATSKSPQITTWSTRATVVTSLPTFLEWCRDPMIRQHPTSSPRKPLSKLFHPQISKTNKNPNQNILEFHLRLNSQHKTRQEINSVLVFGNSVIRISRAFSSEESCRMGSASASKRSRNCIIQKKTQRKSTL